MADRFQQDEVLLGDVLCDGFAVTPSNTTVFSQATRSLWIGGAGNVSVELIGYSGTSTTNVVFYNVPAGTMLNVRAQRVYSTNTTATLITAGF